MRSRTPRTFASRPPMTIWPPGPVGRQAVQVRMVAVLEEPAAAARPARARRDVRVDAQQPGGEVHAPGSSCRPRPARSAGWRAAPRRGPSPRSRRAPGHGRASGRRPSRGAGLGGRRLARSPRLLRRGVGGRGRRRHPAALAVAGLRVVVRSSGPRRRRPSASAVAVAAFDAAGLRVVSRLRRLGRRRSARLAPSSAGRGRLAGRLRLLRRVGLGRHRSATLAPVADRGDRLAGELRHELRLELGRHLAPLAAATTRGRGWPGRRPTAVARGRRSGPGATRPLACVR